MLVLSKTFKPDLSSRLREHCGRVSGKDLRADGRERSCEMPPSVEHTDSDSSHKLTAATYPSPRSPHESEPMDSHGWRKKGPGAYLAAELFATDRFRERKRKSQYFQLCAHWQPHRAPVDNPDPMLMQMALVETKGLQK